MTCKQRIIQAVAELPENATYDEAMERILLLAKLELGKAQAAAGQTLSTGELEARLAAWR